MSPKFDPEPKDSIHLFGQKYTVQPLPSAPWAPYASIAGRAVVYQLRDERGGYFALKVFKKRYRSPELVDSVQKLGRVENFEGLRAAKHWVVRASDPASQKYRDLEYAMLMPWIFGKTWFDVLLLAEAQGYCLARPVAIRLCNRFLEVMEGLETVGMAHTDISPGNVMVELDGAIDAQLLDLEDMYMPGAPAPIELYKGSKGYRHPSGDEGETCWRAEGDRYAAAVLAAEMLVLANPKLASKATDQGFFADHREASQGMDRFREAQVWLEMVAPEFAMLFERSWFADSLEKCPKISELRRPIKELANGITVEDEIPIEDKKIFTENEVLSSLNKGERVKWVPFDSPTPSSPAASKPPKPSPVPPTKGKPVVSWDNQEPGERDDSEEHESSSKAPLIVAAAVILFILFLLILLSAAHH